MLGSGAFRIVAAMAVSLVAASALAQVTGSVFGRVTDQDSRAPLVGVTVVLLGPHGDRDTVTDEDGAYRFDQLPVGDYVLRLHYGDATGERLVVVSVDKTVRADMSLAAASVETVRVEEPAPAVDLGSSRVGVTLTDEFLRNVPLPLTIGGALEKTPGGYLDPVGLSLAGATGAENAYYLDGLNITSAGHGLLGTDLLSPFVEEVEVISGGYDAEYGRALGGVVNIVTKSGGNDFRGSAFSLVAPGFLASDARRAQSWSTSLTGVKEPVYAVHLGAEVGGPIVRDKLFFWAGYAPELGRSRDVRIAERFVDADGDGQLDAAAGRPTTEELYRNEVTGRIGHHQYAGKLSYRPASDHDLSLALFGIHRSDESLRGFNSDLRAAMTRDRLRRHDAIARWTARFFERRWQLEVNAGLHAEATGNDSPHADSRARNAVIWLSAPSLATFDPGVADRCQRDPMSGFESCPLLGYQSGGYGVFQDRSAQRWVVSAKSTHLFRAGGWHQLKVGGDHEQIYYDSRRGFSGPPGGGAYVLVGEDFALTQSFFRLARGERAYTRLDGDDANPDPDMNGSAADLFAGERFRDSLRAETRTQNFSAFLQDSYSPLPNLTFNLGVRWETQRLMDFEGNTAFGIYDSIAPRLGVVYDPSNQGRTKLYGHYGHFYESIPLNLNDRGFGGEGVLVSFLSDCATPFGAWGTGDPAAGWRSCQTPPPSNLGVYGGDNLLVQRRLKGSFTEEIVLGGQVEALRDLTLGAAYIRRRMGRIIEDVAGFVSNPGQIPRSVVDDLNADATAKEMAAGAPGASAEVRAAAQEARFAADTATTAASLPEPRRDYDALQLTAAKRLAKGWLLLASYTYSATRGNYPGLYAADNDQLDPNYTSLYDAPELLMNRDGRLPNDRPHLFRADGFYQHDWGPSSLVAGLGLVARSGRPNNALGTSLVGGTNETFILPRGTAGRTPTVTRFDLHLAYRRRLTEGTTLEAFIDVFNVLNQRTALTQDEVYTFDPVEPIIGGTAEDLPHLQSALGGPAAKNPNYLAATSYQAPISGRLGLRVNF